MNVFKLLVGFVVFSFFIYPLIQQLVFIKDYSDVRNSGEILPLNANRLRKNAIILGFIGLFLLFFSFFSIGIGRICFISVGLAYLIPIVMNSLIKRKCGIYNDGIIQTNEVIKFIDIEKVIIRKPNLVFIDKKEGAKLFAFSDKESNKIIEYLLQTKKLIIESEKIG